MSARPPVGDESDEEFEGLRPIFSERDVTRVLQFDECFEALGRFFARLHRVRTTTDSRHETARPRSSMNMFGHGTRHMAALVNKEFLQLGDSAKPTAATFERILRETPVLRAWVINSEPGELYEGIVSKYNWMFRDPGTQDAQDRAAAADTTASDLTAFLVSANAEHLPLRFVSDDKIVTIDRLSDVIYVRDGVVYIGNFERGSPGAAAPEPPLR